MRFLMKKSAKLHECCSLVRSTMAPWNSEKCNPNIWLANGELPSGNVPSTLTCFVSLHRLVAINAFSWFRRYSVSISTLPELACMSDYTFWIIVTPVKTSTNELSRCNKIAVDFPSTEDTANQPNRLVVAEETMRNWQDDPSLRCSERMRKWRRSKKKTFGIFWLSVPTWIIFHNRLTRIHQSPNCYEAMALLDLHDRLRCAFLRLWQNRKKGHATLAIYAWWSSKMNLPKRNETILIVKRNVLRKINEST